MRKIILLLTILAVAASAALAHSGVKDPQVKARMDAMEMLGAQTKILGQMAKGATSYDANKAHVAIKAMQTEARRVTALFEPPANDPKSEAKPEIWTGWATFAARASDLSNALATADVTTSEALGQSVRAIGTACGACHKQFRE